jgi:hypothetical protein
MFQEGANELRNDVRALLEAFLWVRMIRLG